MKNRNELIKKIKESLDNKKISRLDLLKLVDIDYCLECRGYYYDERTEEGFCFSCEKSWQKGLKNKEKNDTEF